MDAAEAIGQDAVQHVVLFQTAVDVEEVDACIDVRFAEEEA